MLLYLVDHECLTNSQSPFAGMLDLYPACYCNPRDR